LAQQSASFGRGGGRATPVKAGKGADTSLPVVVAGSPLSESALGFAFEGASFRGARLASVLATTLRLGARRFVREDDP
jgi:hypothetical protein